MEIVQPWVVSGTTTSTSALSLDVINKFQPCLTSGIRQSPKLKAGAALNAYLVKGVRPECLVISEVLLIYCWSAICNLDRPEQSTISLRILS
jgi:hypothetical protein